MIHINKTMCIGACCEGFMFADIINTRILGPVDNMWALDFRCICELFNNTLFNKVLNNDCTINTNKIFCEGDDDEFIRWYGCYGQGHVNLQLPNRLESFNKRINNFNNFDINKEGNYYLYTISINDHELSKEDIFNIINKLNFDAINKIIIIGTPRFPIPQNFKEIFKCIEFNLEITNYNNGWYK